MRFINQIVCMFRGHDFGPVVYFSPGVLVYCVCCGKELCDRTVSDLEPMSDEDYDNLEMMDDYVDE